jgi:hypothetical protein
MDAEGEILETNPPFPSVTPAEGDIVPAEEFNVTGSPAIGFRMGSRATTLKVHGPAAWLGFAGVASSDRDATVNTVTETVPETLPPASALETDISSVPGAAMSDLGIDPVISVAD